MNNEIESLLKTISTIQPLQPPKSKWTKEDLYLRKEYWNLKACLENLQELKKQNLPWRYVQKISNSEKELALILEGVQDYVHDLIPISVKRAKVRVYDSGDDSNDDTNDTNISDISNQPPSTTDLSDIPNQPPSTTDLSDISNQPPSTIDLSEDLQSQEQLIQDLTNMASLLADNSNALAEGIKKDSKIVNETSDLLLSNYIKIQKESKKLDEITKSRGGFMSGLKTFILIFVVFIITYFIIRLSPY